MFRSSENSPIRQDYAVDTLKTKIGTPILIQLNFSGNQPPEKRLFAGTITEIGLDYLILKVKRTGNEVMMYFVNVAYIVLLNQKGTGVDTTPPIAPPIPAPIQPPYNPTPDYSPYNSTSGPGNYSPYIPAPPYFSTYWHNGQ